MLTEKVDRSQAGSQSGYSIHMNIDIVVEWPNTKTFEPAQLFIRI